MTYAVTWARTQTARCSTTSELAPFTQAPLSECRPRSRRAGCCFLGPSHGTAVRRRAAQAATKQQRESADLCEVGVRRAHAGPRYERDGTVRPAWVDRVSWAGLLKVSPSARRGRGAAPTERRRTRGSMGGPRWRSAQEKTVGCPCARVLHDIDRPMFCEHAHRLRRVGKNLGSPHHYPYRGLGARKSRIRRLPKRCSRITTSLGPPG